ncbi:hypothetical protein [Clostridium paraputrificum]
MLTIKITISNIKELKDIVKEVRDLQKENPTFKVHLDVFVDRKLG